MFCELFLSLRNLIFPLLPDGCVQSLFIYYLYQSISQLIGEFEIVLREVLGYTIIYAILQKKKSASISPVIKSCVGEKMQDLTPV